MESLIVPRYGSAMVVQGGRTFYRTLHFVSKHDFSVEPAILCRTKVTMVDIQRDQKQYMYTVYTPDCLTGWLNCHADVIK